MGINVLQIVVCIVVKDIIRINPYSADKNASENVVCQSRLLQIMAYPDWLI